MTTSKQLYKQFFYYRILFFSLLLLLLTACRKEDKVNPPSPATPGVEQPVGESTGDGIETVVGAQGGTLVAHDGRLTVVIPAGALSEDITIGIEPITRTLADAPENATKGAYRLTPHGQTFLKPIKIIFRWSDAEFTPLNPAVLGIAYQDNKGKWKGIRNVQVDPTMKTVSVNTTHFSDWTVYETIFLTPKSDVILETGQSLTLQVMEVTPLAPTMEDLNKEEFYLEEPSPVPNPVTWRLVNGPNNGSINAAAAPASATYQAPGMVPVSNNPALVEAKVDLKSLGHLLLLRNITIVEPFQPGIHLRIDGGNWRHFNTTTSFVEGSSYVHSDGDYPYDVHEVSFRINGGHAKGKGTWAWNDQSGTDEETSFEYIVKKPGPYTSYAPFYSSFCPDNDRHVSPGDIRIIEYKKDAYGKTWATGTFFIQQSTPFIENVTCHTMTRQIQGVFKLRVD